MFIKLTNVNPSIKSEIVIINTDAIIAIFTALAPRNETSEEVTIVFGGASGSWEVKESPEEIYNQIL
jgi:hypothetical protein